MGALSTQFRAMLWWLVPLAALAALIGWETDWGRAVEKRPPPAEAVAPKPVPIALLPEYAIEGGVAARAETVQRTLFNPTRRPAPAVTQAGPTRMQRGQFALTGTTVIDGRSTAFLRETAGNRSRRVHAGETINGVLVADVKPDRVKLTLGDESEELVLKVATNPRPTVQPVAVAPAGTAPARAAAPTAAATVAAPAAVPAGTPAADAASLAERRRAARAAAATGSSPAPAPTPPAAPAAVPATSSAPPAVDPRWEQMDQRYRERAAATRGATQ